MLIILDRDGVINYDSEDYIKTPDEWLPIEGSLEAIARLNKAGYTVVVATNQSGVGRGYYTFEILEDIHKKMHRELEKVGAFVDRVYFCPHHPEENCACRKPAPGLLLQIKQDYPHLFDEAILVGDSQRDIEAAQAAGCKAALVKTGKGKKTIAAKKGLENIPIYSNLTDFVNGLL